MQGIWQRKKFLRLENSPPPPHNFSNGPSLKRRDIDLVWELLAASYGLLAESNFVPDCSSLFFVL